jgi:hypothetical protein
VGLADFTALLPRYKVEAVILHLIEGFTKAGPAKTTRLRLKHVAFTESFNEVQKVNYYTAGEFIEKHLRHGQHWNKKRIMMEDAKPQTLPENTHIGGIDYAAGSEFKVFETQNFGWICFKPTAKTPDGNVPGKLIHKW